MTQLFHTAKDRPYRVETIANLFQFDWSSGWASHNFFLHLEIDLDEFLVEIVNDWSPGDVRRLGLLHFKRNHLCLNGTPFEIRNNSLLRGDLFQLVNILPPVENAADRDKLPAPILRFGDMRRGREE